MNGRVLEVIEVANLTDKLRCYVAGDDDGSRSVRARLIRRGRVIEESEFSFDTGLSLRDLVALLEDAMRGIAADAGGRLRIMKRASG